MFRRPTHMPTKGITFDLSGFPRREQGTKKDHLMRGKPCHCKEAGSHWQCRLSRYFLMFRFAPCIEHPDAVGTLQIHQRGYWKLPAGRRSRFQARSLHRGKRVIEKTARAFRWRQWQRAESRGLCHQSLVGEIPGLTLAPPSFENGIVRDPRSLPRTSHANVRVPRDDVRRLERGCHMVLPLKPFSLGRIDVDILLWRIARLSGLLAFHVLLFSFLVPVRARSRPRDSVALAVHMRIVDGQLRLVFLRNSNKRYGLRAPSIKVVTWSPATGFRESVCTKHSANLVALTLEPSVRRHRRSTRWKIAAWYVGRNLQQREAIKGTVTCRTLVDSSLQFSSYHNAITGAVAAH
mmetsp:Transcript_50436/g.141130  ORF Transcript_50436/g.141130 Transcript_50436/m.141130 type:complete len:349 (-) Transcript_50436:9-1055(-)